jgi:hypothetical protein
METPLSQLKNSALMRFQLPPLLTNAQMGKFGCFMYPLGNSSLVPKFRMRPNRFERGIGALIQGQPIKVFLTRPDCRRRPAALFHQRLHLPPILFDSCVEAFSDVGAPTWEADQGGVPSFNFELKRMLVVQDEPRNTDALPETLDFEILSTVREFVPTR